MKILYLMSGFPYPPHGGGALRIMGLLKGAAEAGHEIHIISFGDAFEIPTHTPLHEICADLQIVEARQRSKVDRLRTLLLSAKADMQTRSFSKKMVSALRKKLSQEPFDIVHLQSLEMGVYAQVVRQLQPTAKLIYDAYNAEAELQRMVYEEDIKQMGLWPMAIYSWLQYRRLKRYEANLCAWVDAVIAVSSEDQALLRAIAGETPVYLVNNGIDVDHYTQLSHEPIDLAQPALVFTGTMDYRPNVDAAVWFTNEVLPQIMHPVTVYFVGSRPSQRVQKLAENRSVIVTGFVEDIEPYLQGTTLFIVPLRVGSGTRLKILQAMSAGCAIVSTSIGAMGLNIENGRELILADSAEDFAFVIDGLLQDDKTCQMLAENAGQFVRQNFDWSVIVGKLNQLYHDLTSQS